MENQSIALAKMLNTNFKLIDYNPPYFLKKFPFGDIGHTEINIPANKHT